MLKRRKRKLFDDNATGTGGEAPAPAPSPSPSPSPEPSPSPSPDPAPAPTPAAPVAPTPATPTTPSGTGEFTLPDFPEDLDSDDVVVLDPTVSGTPEPTPAPAPAQTPEPTPPPAVATPPQPAPEPAPAPAAGTEAPASNDPPLDRTNPAAVADFVLQNMEAAIPALAQQVYNLSPQEVEGLETNAIETVPRLLARVHINATAAAMHRMSEMVPHLISKHMAASQRNSANAEAFYQANPHLDRSDANVQAQVANTARVYRQMNPNATRDEMIKAVGIIVGQALGRAPAAAQPPASAPSPVPAGFVPAATSAGAPVPAPMTSDPWEGLGQNFEE